jgi:hypothetical protein
MAVLSVLYLAVGLPAAQARPGLRPVAGVHGAFLISDGVRYAAVGATAADPQAGGVLLDTVSGRRSALPHDCPGGHDFAWPHALGGETFLSACQETLLLTDLRTDRTRPLPSPRITAEHSAPAAIGRRWIESEGWSYHGAATSSLFNPTTGEELHQEPKEPPTTTSTRSAPSRGCAAPSRRRRTRLG